MAKSKVKRMDAYWVKGVKKADFFAEYEKFEDIVRKGEVIDLLRDPKAIVYEVSRRMVPVDEWSDEATAEEKLQKFQPSEK